jgi:hypothetical protein
MQAKELAHHSLSPSVHHGFSPITTSAHLQKLSPLAHHSLKITEAHRNVTIKVVFS